MNRLQHSLLKRSLALFLFVSSILLIHTDPVFALSVNSSGDSAILNSNSDASLLPRQQIGREEGQAGLEKDLSKSLKDCARIIQQIKNRSVADKPIAKQLQQLPQVLDDLEVTHLLMQERHLLRLDKANGLGGKAAERQAAMAERYRQAMDNLLSLLGQLKQDGVDDINLLEEIETLLQQLTSQQQLPIHGVLPYRQLNYSVINPVFAPTIVPAYQAGSMGSVSADLAGAPEAPISKLIADQAKAIATAAGIQNWDPVAIYEWIKNNIETEWYFGVMKGAEETLRQGRGNDADQAALLVGLLRASNYPARYVRGVVEFFPGIDAVKSLTGIEDPAAIGDFFRKAGIPHQPVMNGLDIVNYQVEHVWVETFVPYANYRGAMADEQGKIWLPLDTSFKVAGYDESGVLDIFNEVGNPLSTIRDNYLGASQTETPLDYLKSEVDTFLAFVAPGTLYNSVLHTRTLRDETLHILPSAPQFTEIAVTGEYTSLPPELIHAVSFQATSPAPESLPLLNVVLPTYQLSNQQVVVLYEPETVEDQEIINTWGGLANTPAYLVRVRPVLMVNDERITFGENGVPAGSRYDLSVTLTSPSGVASFTNTQIVGYPTVIGLVAQEAVLSDPVSLQIEAVDLLFNEVLNYINRWNQGEAELSELFNLRTTRPVPSVVTVGGAMEVVELLGQPQGLEWKGVYIDADLRSIETVERNLSTDDRENVFMQLSALQGSVLENRVFEDAFETDSISTAKLFGLANDSAIPILTINATNVDTIVPALPFADNIKTDINDAVAQGLTVQIPDQPVTYQDWSGVGYIKEDLVTGASGYMLSGQIAGGMTAVTPGSWVYQHVYALQNPGLQESNEDPFAAASIHKIGGTDYQVGVAGESLNDPLTVLVRDAEGRPVIGAQVTFTIERGGGEFVGPVQSITVNTDQQGMARTQPNLILGQNIMDEAITYGEDGYEHASYARENTVTATLDNGTKLLQPFMAIAIPGLPTQLLPFGNQIYGGILQYAGEIGAQLLDKYNNPVANVPIQYSAGAPTSWHGWCDVADANQNMIDVQLTTDDACVRTLPSWGECGVSGTVIGKTWSNGVVSGGVTMGSYPDGQYPLTLSYVGPALELSLADAHFTGYTTEAPPGSFCGGHTPPTGYLSIHREDNLYRVRPAGVPVKVRAKAEMLAEGIAAQLSTDSLTCGEASLSCPQVQGDHAFDFTVPDSIGLNFNGSVSELSSSAPDMYESEIVLAVGNNDVAVHAVATRMVDLFDNSCAGGCASQTTSETVPYSADWTIAYTGVSIDMPEFVNVGLNEFGFPLANIPVDYTIQPIDYDAVSASFLVYKNGNFVYVAGTDTQGANTDQIPTTFWFDTAQKYTVQVVLNYNWGEAEIWSDKIPVVFADQTIDGKPFNASRMHIISQFDDNVTTAFPDSYIDSYREFPFTLSEAANVRVSILDSEMNEQAELVPSTGKAAGDYLFVVDYSQLNAAGFSIYSDHEYVIQYEQINDSDGRVIKALYPGRLSEQVSKAKILGQTIVHNVMLQDGSLNLSRTDLSVQGRGPDFTFTRSYYNQFASEDHNPLGNGWSHSLDLRLHLLNFDNGGNGSVPDWVTNLKGGIYTADQKPVQGSFWDQVQANGTMFRRVGTIWYAQRGNHGTLTDIPGGFRFTAKDGTQYDYDVDAGELTLAVSKITDRNGNAMLFSYGAQQQLETVTDAVGREFVFSYDLYNTLDEDPWRLASVSGPDGLLLSFTYDLWGNLLTAERDERIETYEYVSESGKNNGDFNMVKAVDANGHAIRYEYHGPGEIDLNLTSYLPVVKDQSIIKQVIYPDNTFAVFQYDGTTGNKRTVTDLRSNDTFYTLNTYGNPLKIDEPLGKTTQMTWSIDEAKPDNVMTSRTDPRGHTTFYTHDAKGNVATETDPYGKTITTVWNQSYSLPESRTDRNGVVQSWNYDPTTGNLNYHDDGDGKRTSYTYHATGEVQTVTDPRLNTTNYSYDLQGNPDTITGPEGSVTDFDYDLRGRKGAETDPNLNKTSYAYDALDYLSSITYPTLTSYTLPSGSSKAKSFDYDALGNLLSETDRVGQTLTYLYTSRDQVKKVARSSGGEKSFDYDANGNLTSESDWKGGATTHTYDVLNRRDNTTNRLGNSMAMSYDLSGNLTQVTDFEGRVTDYEYDDLSRQTKVIQPKLANQAARGEIVTTYYDEADSKSNVKTVTDAEGNLTSFEYNGRYQKTKRTNALLDEFVWQYDAAGNLASETDEESKITSYTYDRQSRRTSMTQPGAIVTSFQYDSAGNQTHVTDTRNNTTETVFDQWNRPWQVIDAELYTTTNELDGEGREVKVVDGNDHARTFERDTRGLVLTAIDAENFNTLFSYDLNGNVETVTNARGFITRTNYDAEDRKLLTTEAEGTAAVRTSGVVVYDKAGNALQVRDGNGNISVTQFNVLNLPSKQFDPAPFSANFVEVLYDKNGQPTSVQNRLGHITTTSYDALGRVDTVTDPAPFNLQTMVTTYDKVGNVKTVKDKRNIVSENIYDDLYRLTEQQRDSIRLVTNEYDDAGNLTATIDAENNRVEYTYNSRNLLEKTTFIDGVNNYFTEQFYDGVGNLLTHCNEEGEVTTTTFDKENRQKTIKFANETTENVYDEVGNLTQVIKPKLNGSVVAYDGLNRLTSVIEGNLLTTAYTYDNNNNQLTQTDPLGNAVEFTYDELNRKTLHTQKKASGDLIVNYDGYDAEGNLTQMTDAKGQVFGYAYDELNRLTLIDHPLDLTTPFMAIDKVETAYDENNNVETVTETKQINGGGTQTDTTSNVWDNFDRLKSSTQRGITLSYGYDNNGNRISVATVNGSTTYGFDHRNRLQTATVGSDVTNYSYTPDGLTDTILYPNGTGANYRYWPTNRVETITHQDSADATISSFDYLYDANGNRTQQIEVQGGVTETTTYVYDELDRLETFTVTDGVDSTVTGYTFEGYNRKSETHIENGSTMIDKVYSYDETNWLTDVVDNVTLVTIDYTYDNNGNTIIKTDSSKPDNVLFSYDVANRMVQTTQGATLLGQYDYNASGMRVRHYGSERGDVDYFYDDGAVLEEYVAGAGGGLLAHYRYGDRLLSLDAPGDGGVQYYHHDGLGSTVNLTDSAGATKVSYTLDPWGHIRNQIGASVNRQVFTGQEHDVNTGLIYFGARYYDPDVGRFINQDSYLGEAGTPPSLHRYLYAYGNPMVWVDLYGFASVKYLPRYDYGEDDDGSWQPNIFSMRYDDGEDAISGGIEVLDDTINITAEVLDGGVDIGVTAIGGTKDVALSIASLPLLAVERIGGFRNAGSFVPYARKHVQVSFESFVRRWCFSRKAQLTDSLLMFGQEVPLVGNFVPGARGNMNGDVTGIIGGGINAINKEKSRERDLYTTSALPQDVKYKFANNDRDSATRVGLSLFFGYRAKGLEAAEQIVNSVDSGSTVKMYGHSGGVQRLSVASKYTGIYDIGVSKLAADQGPGLGLYNNIGSLQATYSTGLKDPTSVFGAALSFGYWSTGKNRHVYSGDRGKGLLNAILGDAHSQNGNPKGRDPNSNAIGNEYTRWTYDFLVNP